MCIRDRTRFGIASASSSTRACFAGGSQPGSQNVIESVTIGSTGNATDFGDLTRYATVAGGLSDAHGGLAQ